MTSIVIIIVATFVMIWSLVGSLRHQFHQMAMASKIVAKLRPTEKRSMLLGPLRHPFLPFSKEAEGLAESKSMMVSYWKSGLYGVVFLTSTIVLAATYQSAFG